MAETDDNEATYKAFKEVAGQLNARFAAESVPSAAV